MLPHLCGVSIERYNRLAWMQSEITIYEDASGVPYKLNSVL